MAAPVRCFMKAARLQAPQLICHLGGAKVLDAIEVARELQKAPCVMSVKSCAATAICRHRLCCSF
jgi:hypothetical protein